MDSKDKASAGEGFGPRALSEQPGFQPMCLK